MQDSSIYTYSDPDEMTDIAAIEEEIQAVNDFRDIFYSSSFDEF